MVLFPVQIKKERMEEKLRLARLSQRLHFQDEGRGRLSHLYKKILTALHRQRKVSEILYSRDIVLLCERVTRVTVSMFLDGPTICTRQGKMLGFSACLRACADVLQ